MPIQTNGLVKRCIGSAMAPRRVKRHAVIVVGAADYSEGSFISAQGTDNRTLASSPCYHQSDRRDASRNRS